MVTQTKIDKSFPASQFIIPSFILVYIREDIPSKLLNVSYIALDIEYLGNIKWLVIC